MLVGLQALSRPAEGQDVDDWCDGVVVVLPAGVSPFDSSAVFAVLIGTIW